MTHYTPNLPALITALPGDHTRAPQTEFTRARQVLFLDNLSVTGSVRSAAAAGGVSHQTAYRARRGQGHFRLAWDAALLAARANAEATLAARAIDGVEEQVFYHGEAVATRRRYCSRLLLAHLARLDRLVESPDAAAFAGDWDEALARFERGEAPLAPAPEPAPEPGPQPSGFSSSGPCNTWSMSPAGAMSPAPKEDFDDSEWDEEALAEAMEEDRPLDAPPLELLGDPAEVAACQRVAFECEDEEWWRFGEDFALFVRDADGRWVPDPSAAAPDEEV